MIFSIVSNYLIADAEQITWETFKLLTGKTLDLKKRIEKKTEIKRIKGHTYIYDLFPIIGEFYKVDNKIYTCVSICNEEAILTSPNKLEAIIKNSRVQIA